MHFLFLNQYFPPDPAPTGTLMAEIAEMLREAGHTVDLVAPAQSYREAHGRGEKGGRMKREMLALLRLAAAAVRARRPAVIVSGTSPPLLLVIATVAAQWHRARSVHWAMDLYPELAVELGELPRGVVSAFLTRLAGWCYQRSEVVALDADMRDHLQRRYGVEAAVLRPWTVRGVLASMPIHEVQPVAPWTWTYSGNLGRAHEWETLLMAQQEIEACDPEIRLVFQGGGPEWPAAKARAEELELRRCDWRPYVPEEELAASLLASSACAVTQRPEAQGLLWPSKLSLLLALPRPILWVGPAQGAVATLLREHGHRAIFAPGDFRGLAECLLQLRKGTPGSIASVDPGGHRAQSLERWRVLLSRLSAG